MVVLDLVLNEYLFAEHLVGDSVDGCMMFFGNTQTASP